MASVRGPFRCVPVCLQGGLQREEAGAVTGEARGSCLFLTPWLLFDFQVLLAPWDLQAFRASPRRLLFSLASWVPRAGEAFPVHRER